MKNLRTTIYVLIFVAATLLIIFSFLSIFKNTESRYLKLLDFPRIQFFIASFISLALLPAIARKKEWYDYAVMAGLLGAMFVNGSYLVNYTVLVPVEVSSIKETKASDVVFSILITNVKMSNRNEQPLFALIENKKPDIILAMEINGWWEQKLQQLKKEYPYQQKTINEVAYGMVIYSKFEIQETDVAYLNNEQVPSFKSVIGLPQDKKFSLHSVHPVPPTNFENFPDNAGQNEVAMQKLGVEISNRTLPVVVAGDINDVVWSHVDELTGTKDILYDVRVGRGFYNSYHAGNVLMRWPLDHIFVTKEFRLKRLELLTNIGSDHFPLYAELVL